MKASAIIVLLLVLAVGCTPTVHEEKKHEEHEMTKVMRIHSGAEREVELHGYSVKFETEHLEVGTEAHLTFTFEGDVELQEHHGALMHVIVVSKDLNQFYHLHPESQGAKVLDAHHTFEEPGEYRVWIDFVGDDMNHIIDFDIQVIE